MFSGYNKIYKIDKNDTYEEIKDNKVLFDIIEKDLEFREFDQLCDKMNKIKYDMLKKTSLAHMGCVVVSSKERPIIGTQALDTCYGILFYDRERKEGICGHAIPSNLVGTLSEMMLWFGDDNRVIEYMFVPGFRNVDYKNYRGLSELSNYLFSHVPSNIKLKSFSSDFSPVKLHQATLSYEFAFDTESGEFVTKNVFFDAIEHNPRYIAPKRF